MEDIPKTNRGRILPNGPSSMSPCKRKTVDLRSRLVTTQLSNGYLGSAFSTAVHIDDDATASVVFGRLRGNICDRNGLRFDTKLTGNK